MGDWGFVMGLVIGMGAGFIIGRAGRKPWSELTEKEKKIRIGIIAGLAILVVATAVVFFVVI